jgi:DNA-binding transcriptional regulator YiaG
MLLVEHEIKNIEILAVREAADLGNVSDFAISVNFLESSLAEWSRTTG